MLRQCVCDPYPLHRGIRHGEAQNSVSTKIKTTCFFVAPSVTKSQPAAITGAKKTNSCLETPEAVSLSSSAHQLSSLQQQEGGKTMVLLCKEALRPD